ncbi:MAG: hypothetical protein B7X90_08170 [Novosphingobium sp. 17-62-19]|uniref:ArnT family glycosyltransferase n=1 Tax=Novosphingobium sp. 17-62-19 TaxID=1970406 RepID=UPI000BD5F932|nr:hypothetical protein [Novosphingobium sp. 17-62-19]OYX95620.1 MAG: hypothetical protein B7Y74_03780 [Novosphingobium sp. 35-62-5]OZA19641.1 MAG: hypothetical protein B7X90_08170 [Novosphingobium sp. 17-62-19]OZA72766.1 MAG: hypothetical protein B7X78_00335 [Sphingomonadales bacterium 39-62-4]HQS98125.1 hypothetical protein [Novosphingobium sp.]
MNEAGAITPSNGGPVAVPTSIGHPPLPSAVKLQRLPSSLLLALAYLGLFLITRSFLFGNPIVHIDEQFYLFVAERMGHGAVPYVDIWDRKPVGLFVLYEAFVALPGDALLAYQFGAALATAGTALAISRLAREIASPAASWQAGVAYVLFMPAFNAGMGQAPVFYNLLVAVAALIVVDAMKRNEDKALVARGCAVMLLLGLAIQIKYTVIFEGAAFGLMLLARGFADIWTIRRLAAVALLWVTVALVPTLAAIAWYAGIGQLDAFIYANFISIFERGSDGARSYGRLAKECAALLPVWLAIFRAPRMFDTSGGLWPRSHSMLKIWGVVACLGFLLFGTWYDHYVTPLLVPLCVLAAPALARAQPGERWYGRFLLGFAALAGTVVPIYQVWRHGTATQYAEMSALISQEMRGGCLFIYEGELAFYRTIPTCLPTTRIFPNHLNTFIESTAVGMDPAAEVRRILANRPDVILMWAPQKLYLPNLETRAVMNKGLTQAYERYARYTLGTREYWLYRLRPNLRNPASSNAVQ